MVTVLVVDDDPDVLEIASGALAADGFQVLEAASPADALETLRRETPVHLLVTDIKMPGMSGFELADRAKRMCPKLRVLYMSGFLPDIPWGQHGVGHGPMVVKPWRLNDFQTEVRTALFGRQAPREPSG